MINFNLFSQKLKKTFIPSKNRYLILGAFLGLMLFFLTRGCHSNISAGREYDIGQDNRWPGLNLMGKERNLSAFNNDLLTAIARQEKINIRLIPTASSDLIADLEKGKLQGILSTLQPNYLDKNRFVSSEPYFLLGPVLIISSAAPLKDLNENNKKIIAVQPGSPFVNLEQDATIQTKPYADILSALTDLNDRKIDGALYPAIPAYTYVMTFFKNDLKISTLPLTDEGVRLVALNNEEGKNLIHLFNQSLADLKEKNSYDKMLERWSLINPEKLKL